MEPAEKTDLIPKQERLMDTLARLQNKRAIRHKKLVKSVEFQHKSVSSKSSSVNSSQKDNKDDPNFFIRDESFMRLPPAVQKVVEHSYLKSKHSDFYYKLSDLTNKIILYKRLFYNKVPDYQVQFMEKKIKDLEQKQTKARELFQQTIDSIENKQNEQQRLKSAKNKV
jgi:hypothetical protein